MNTSKNEQGEPPAFAKWLIWLFRRDTWATRPFIASVASIIALSTLLSSIYGGYRFLVEENEPRIESPTWERNYQLFASRNFPQIRDARMAGDPVSGYSAEVRASFLRSLRSLVLVDEPELETRRIELVSLVEVAPVMNERNPGWFRVDDELGDARKNLLHSLEV